VKHLIFLQLNIYFFISLRVSICFVCFQLNLPITFSVCFYHIYRIPILKFFFSIKENNCTAKEETLSNEKLLDAQNLVVRLVVQLVYKWYNSDDC
jgi:hypothetical protein